MKKIINILSVSLLLATFTSCDKDEPGGTATQKMAGEWMCIVDGVDADGNVTYEDPYDMGYISVYTYNTNANVPTEMYLDDEGLWPFRAIVDINLSNLTFWTTGVEDDYRGVNVQVINGQITPGGAISPAGYVTDGISFMVRLENDDDADAGAWDYLWYHGYRITGLDGGND